MRFQILVLCVLIGLSTTIFQDVQGKVICKGGKGDIILVVDSSTSIGDANFAKVKLFLIKFTESLEIGKHRVHLALVTFSTHATLQFDYLHDKAAITSKITSMSYEEGVTFTGEALQLAYNKLIHKKGRAGVKKILILVTDGRSNGMVQPIEEAKIIKDEKVVIDVVGITDSVNKAELSGISSSGTYHAVSGFSKLVKSVKAVTKITCSVIKPPKTPCSKISSEIILVLDSSTSVGSDNFKIQKKFIRAIVNAFPIGAKKVRVALVRFNTQAEVIFPLLGSKKQIKSKINKMKFTEGLTFMGEALDLVRTAVLPAARKNVKKVVILITDGKSNGSEDPKEVATKLKTAGTIIIVVGITSSVNASELKAISSDNAFSKVDDFNKLMGFVTELTKKACHAAKKHKVCNSLAGRVAFVLDASTSVGGDNFEHEKNFVISIVNNLDVGTDKMQVALIKYNTQPEVVFNFLSSSKKIIKKVKAVKFSEGFTATGDALLLAEKEFFASLKKSEKKTLILITDGKTTIGEDSITAAKKLKKAGINIIVVGITHQVNPNELSAISSDGKFFKSAKFTDLPSLTSLISKKTCKLVSG